MLGKSLSRLFPLSGDNPFGELLGQLDCVAATPAKPRNSTGTPHGN